MSIKIQRFSEYVVSPLRNLSPKCDQELLKNINFIIQRANNFSEQDLVNYLILSIRCGKDCNGLKRRSIVSYLSYCVRKEAISIFNRHQYLRQIGLDEIFHIGWELISDNQFMEKLLRKYQKYQQLHGLNKRLEPYAKKVIYYIIFDRAKKSIIQNRLNINFDDYQLNNQSTSSTYYGLPVQDLANNDFRSQVKLVIPHIDFELSSSYKITTKKDRIKLFIRLGFYFGLKSNPNQEIADICGCDRATVGRSLKKRSLDPSNDGGFLHLLSNRLRPSCSNYFEFNEVAIILEETRHYYEKIAFQLFKNGLKLYLNGEITVNTTLVTQYRQYIQDRNLQLLEQSWQDIFTVCVEQVKSYLEQHHVIVSQTAYPTLIKITYPLIDLWQRPKNCQQD